MALNNCFSSPTCTSMTAHLGGRESPADACSLRMTMGVVEFARSGTCFSIASPRGTEYSILIDKNATVNHSERFAIFFFFKQKTAYEIGTAKLEPEKLVSIAKLTPITLPSLLNTG